MPQCTFCGKTEGEPTASSEPGPRVYVCADCAAQANKIVEEELGKQPPPS
jgi:ribosome-binding protein aMBF1 (putative translation factor)